MQRTVFFQQVVGAVTSLMTGIESVVVACSGGPDSVFLAHVIREIFDKNFILLYLDHGLRPVEHERRLVQQLGDAWGIPTIVQRIDVAEFMATHTCSAETAGHHLRRESFLKIATQNNISAVLTGHHSDDSIETFLMKWFRGAQSGLLGLQAAIQLSEKVTLMRPLLAYRKKDIEDALVEMNIVYCMDPTNADTAIKRNWIRHDVLPHFKKMVPDIDQKLEQLLHHLHLQSRWIEDSIAPLMKNLVIGATQASFPLELLQNQSQERVSYLLYRICQQVYARWEDGYTDVHVEATHIALMTGCIFQEKGKINLPLNRFFVIQKKEVLIYFLNGDKG